MRPADYLPIIRRRIVVVVAVTVVTVASAVALASVAKPVYASKGRLLVAKPASVFASGDNATTDPDFVQTEIQILQSEAVRNLVREALGTASDVSAVQVGTTSVVEVSALAMSPKRAADTVNAYMDSYLNFHRQEATAALLGTTQSLQLAIDDIQKQIDALTAQRNSIPCPPTGECPARSVVEQDRNARVSEQVPLREKLAELNIDASTARAGSVVTPAAVRPDPVSPQPLRNGAAALVLGGLLGVAIATLIERLDDSLDTIDDIERAAPGVVVLATIPSTAVRRKRDRLDDGASLSVPASPQGEGYQALRTSIRLLTVGRPLRSIQVTSAAASEGKTATAANLGLVLARAGERVFVIDCDLWEPRLHTCFGVSNDVGLTSVLAGEATLEKALQRVTNDERLSLLSAGPPPPNPSDFLASARASQLLSRLQTLGTLVLDCPPLVRTSDWAILSAEVDGTILVVRPGVSSRKKVARAVAVLRQTGAPLLGMVVHGLSGPSVPDHGHWVPSRPAEDGHEHSRHQGQHEFGAPPGKRLV